MKKCLLFLFFLLTSVSGWASYESYDGIVDGIGYKLYEGSGEAMVTYILVSSHYYHFEKEPFGLDDEDVYFPYRGEINIPEEIIYRGKTYRVTSIDDYAFYKCDGLLSVTIPNSVTSIGSSAFSGCSGLTSVTIPNSVTSIGSYAFFGTGWYNNQSDGLLYLCNWLLGYKGTKPIGKLQIADGTRGIGGSAFYGCSGLTSVTIPDGVTSIGGVAFKDCHDLTYVTIPDGVTSIGDGAFNDCHDLTYVTIPDGVTSIGDGAFKDCWYLRSVTIPNSVTYIGDNAFSGTRWYNNQSDGLLYLCNWLLGYKGTKPIGELQIADGTRGIVGRAFYGCSGLTSVTIPNSVTSIGDYAFSACI